MQLQQLVTAPMLQRFQSWPCARPYGVNQVYAGMVPGECASQSTSAPPSVSEDAANTSESGEDQDERVVWPQTGEYVACPEPAHQLRAWQGHALGRNASLAGCNASFAASEQHAGSMPSHIASMVPQSYEEEAWPLTCQSLEGRLPLTRSHTQGAGARTVSADCTSPQSGNWAENQAQAGLPWPSPESPQASQTGFDDRSSNSESQNDDEHGVQAASSWPRTCDPWDETTWLACPIAQPFDMYPAAAHLQPVRSMNMFVDTHRPPLPCRPSSIQADMCGQRGASADAMRLVRGGGGASTSLAVHGDQGPSGQGARIPYQTGVCTLHISCRESQSALKERLGDRGFDYDFLWVPVKTEGKRKVGKDIFHGYAWVNFTSPEEARLAKIYLEQECEYRNSKYPVKACKCQGLGELRAHLRGKVHPSDGRPFFRSDYLGQSLHEA